MSRTYVFRKLCRFALKVVSRHVYFRVILPKNRARVPSANASLLQRDISLPFYYPESHPAVVFSPSPHTNLRGVKPERY